MAATCKNFIRFSGLLGLLSLFFTSFAQTGELDAEKWAAELNKKGKEGNDSYRTLDSLLEKTDSIQTFEFLDKLAAKGKNDFRFLARFKCLKSHQIYTVGFYKNRPSGTALARKSEIQELLIEAMDEAYRSGDDHVIILVSSWFGKTMIQFGELGMAVMYGMNSIDLSEKISSPIHPYDYQFMSEMLYRVREYNACIKYALKAVEAWKISDPPDLGFLVSSLNTVALGYHRQNNYDSALVYYDQALRLAKEKGTPVWIGIVSGNMAQIYYAQKKYDTAYTAFIKDYRTSKDSGYYDNAANSLQWAARSNLALGSETKALAEVREAFDLLRLWPDAGYLRNAYYTATEIFRRMKNYDSAFYYNNLYFSLNDSLEKVVAANSLAITRARLNDKTSRYNIETLDRQKKAQIMLRNIIIAGLILFSLFALLMVNRKRLKTKMKMEKAEQERQLMQREAASARDQLRMFTENIVEKTNLIEKLELHIKGKEATAGQQEIISELGRQTILTEEDWNRFKSLFEKIYPGFFINMIDKFPDITLAEQRMAALTRLHLSTKQIASMLGISVDSVHKSRQRLRQRFQVGTDANLDELVANL